MLKLGLIGYPLEHSLSPRLHQAAMHALKLEGEYRLYPLIRDAGFERNLSVLLERVRLGDLQGLNVTVPYKQVVIPYLDRLSSTAVIAGAVNTIYFRDGQLVGENTDVPGFLTDLKRCLHQRKTPDHVAMCALVLGAGGSARAVLSGLCSQGWQVYLAARRTQQAQALVAEIETQLVGCRIGLASYDASGLTTAGKKVSLLVNTTPVGMWPQVESSPWLDGARLPPQGLVYDLVYNPAQTQLLKQAKQAGLEICNGIGMLVEQAALAFEIWTGSPPPRKAMLASVPEFVKFNWNGVNQTMENQEISLNAAHIPIAQTAQRMQHLSPHFFAGLGAKINAMQQSGLDIIRLDEGSPDLPPAGGIIQALTRSAAQAGSHAYQPHRGSAALRRAWAHTYQQTHQVSLDPEEEVLPLLGSKEGIFHLQQALIEPGDVVIVPDPGYISYSRGALFAGGQPVSLPLLAENDYLPDFSMISKYTLSRTKILWLNYPNNPTAAQANLAFFEQAVAFAQQHGILLCHDAAYARVTFNGKPAPSLMQIAGARQVAVEFNTLSKSHNMAGWRSAALVGNAQVLKALFTLKTNQDSGHFLPIQEGTIEALTGDQSWVEQRNLVYRRRRDILVQGLRQLGFDVQEPQASLYIWCPTPKGMSSVDFAAQALEQALVSFTPGVVFGLGGEGFVRISITAPESRLEEAIKRLAKWRQA
jgi:LL-diaminopimelate aminotransferase